MSKVEQLEAKVRKVIEQFHLFRRENDRLRSECETLKSQVAMMSGDNRKAQRMLAEYDQLKRNSEQAAVRVERALQKLAAARLQ